MTEPRVYVPRPYQQIATRFIYEHKRCNLWMVPGMGKTSTVYQLFDWLKLLGSSFFPALIIAPLKVAQFTWPAERRKWKQFNDLKVVEILGESDVRDDALMTRGDVYVVNYDNIQWLGERLRGKKWPFKIVVPDEATRLKNFRLNQKGSKRASVLSDIAMHTGRWINLTGTPAPNTLVDLWGQQWFVDFGQRLYPTFGAYMSRWFVENPYTRRVELRHPVCEAEIHAAVADCTLAMRAEDWFDIEQPTEMIREVELPPAARAKYNEMERDFFTTIANKDISAVNQAVLSGKLLQMASGAVYDENKTAQFVHDAKTEGLRSLVEELAEPLLVSYWFQWEPPMLKKAFPGIRFLKTQKDQDDWNKGKIPLMGVHPGAAGHGIDLQYGGRAICHLTHQWDLELYLQVNERIGPVRQLQAGFNRNVLHYMLAAKDTMDEEAIERKDSKRSIQDALMLARAHRG
jgi:hypothetical protein